MWGVVEFGLVMNLYYLAPFLCLPVAMYAPAADVQWPTTVETAAELIPVLKDVEKLTMQQARELLRSMPVPKQCSRALKARLEVFGSLPDFLALAGKSGEEASAIRARILPKSPGMWLGCLFLEMTAAKREGDKAWEARLEKECVTGLLELGPESGLGVVQVLLGGNLFQEQKPAKSEAEKAEWNRGVAERLQTLPNAPDAQIALAMSYLYEEMGIGVDVEKSMVHALRGAVAGEFLLGDSPSLRNNLRLSLARAAAIKGAAALPLQVAALRQIEASDKEQAGLAAYRLGRLYHSLPEGLNLVAEALGRWAYIEGANLGHPACLQVAAETCATEEPEEAARLYRLAEAAKFDPQKDYLNGAHERLAVTQVYCPAFTLPDAAEREVCRYLSRLVSKARLTDYLTAFSGPEGEAFKMILPVWDILLNGMEKPAPEQELEYLDRPDTEEEEGKLRFVQWLQKMQLALAENPDAKEVAEGFAQGAAMVEELLRASKSGDSISEEQLALLQKLADARDEHALYLLAWRQVKFLGVFTQESWDMMVEASERGSAEASWFLYSVFWEGLYGLDPDPLNATHCYRRALSQRSDDAWNRVRERAEDDVSRLYARIHMRHSSGGEKYSLPLDDELQAYAAAHPELQGIIAPLRLLYFGLALKEDSLTAEENRELRLRALALAEAVQPAVLKAEDVEFWRQQAEYEYRSDRHSERSAAAKKALSALKEGSADLALVVDNKLAYTQMGQDVAQVPTDKLPGAHLVCRECDRALADFAIKAGLRSVTALRMPVTERDYLRAHNIAAGGWEIVRE